MASLCTIANQALTPTSHCQNQDYTAKQGYTISSIKGRVNAAAESLQRLRTSQIKEKRKNAVTIKAKLAVFQFKALSASH